MADRFETRLDNLKDSVRAAGETLIASARSVWFSIAGDTPVDGLDEQSIRDTFARDQEVLDYQNAINNPESFRKAQAAKLQNDTLAAMERDTRMRHRGRVRLMAHASAKMTSHGLDDGPIKRGVLFVNRLKEQASG